MNINQYKNIRSSLIILKEENKKGFEKCNHSLRNHCINLLEGFNKMFKNFDEIQNHILEEIGVQ